MSAPNASNTRSTGRSTSDSEGVRSFELFRLPLEESTADAFVEAFDRQGHRFANNTERKTCLADLQQHFSLPPSGSELADRGVPDDLSASESTFVTAFDEASRQLVSRLETVHPITFAVGLEIIAQKYLQRVSAESIEAERFRLAGMEAAVAEKGSAIMRELFPQLPAIQARGEGGSRGARLVREDSDGQPIDGSWKLDSSQ